MGILVVQVSRGSSEMRALEAYDSAIRQRSQLATQPLRRVELRFCILALSPLDCEQVGLKSKH